MQAKEALCTQPTVLAEAWQAEFGMLSSARERKPERRDRADSFPHRSEAKNLRIIIGKKELRRAIGGCKE